MWPFKKKPKITKPVLPVFETLICIPGTWADRDAFILSIVSATNGEYMAAGNILLHPKDDRHYTFQFCEHDDKMRNAFAYLGKVSGVSEDFLADIDKHTFVIYLTGTTGNLEEAKHMAFAAGVILKSGGLGVKIESAGKAFEGKKWLEYLDSFDEPNLYEMFVIGSIMMENGTVFSCGMQNLGHKDTIISGEDFQYAVSLISIFGYYQLIDKPTIQNNETFTPTIDSPKFRITDETDQPYKDANLFENPFGMWRLTRDKKVP